MYQLMSQISALLTEPFLNVAYSIKGVPLLFAFFLGLVGAMAPCQFTANIGAITLYGNRTFKKD